ncbi:hypothetical protein [Luteimonas sp. MHLX1A]|uniref:hypothetical protein n=1 Tax=Alterluteimonas muca TaxID=2878684 RepID=UPI001E2D7749|nr:hypothetical protein [Luteimonas sp. MHLX1A]
MGAVLTLYGDRLRSGPGHSYEAEQPEKKSQKTVSTGRISTKKKKKIKEDWRKNA